MDMGNFTGLTDDATRASGKTEDSMGEVSTGEAMDWSAKASGKKVEKYVGWTKSD